MSSNAKAILGILAAGAVGVAIGMLLAPEKGSDLRKTIKGSVDDLGEKLLGLIGQGKEYLEDGAEEVQEQAKGMKNDIKNRVDNTKEALS